jgi:glycosyltransferase involved in cell wall biosynthesis
MRTLFCHDGPLCEDEYGDFYGSAHNDATFSRYYNISEEVAVAIRVNKISKNEAASKLSKITLTPFEVVECPNISSLKGQIYNRQKAEQIILNEVGKSDYIVIRLPSFIGNLAVDAARKLNKPYLIEVVACPWDGFWNHSLIGKMVAPYMYFKTKKHIMDACFVVYVTNEFLQKRYPTNGITVSCSNVALKEFNINILEDRIKKIGNIKKNNKFVIGTTAAVDVRYKGQQYIIKALGKLKEHGITNFEYQLVGGGDQTYLKSIAEKNNVGDQVVFLGSMKHNDVFKWLETIDIYTQPSRQEGLPRALIEAMSLGLPAFGAKTAGIPELLDPEFIFNNSNNSIEEIYNILLKFNAELMLEQSQRNYHESKKYDKDIIESRRKEFFKFFASNNVDNN